MPVIRTVPQDPTDLVIQGEEMRLAAIRDGLHSGAAAAMSSALLGAVVAASLLVPGEQNFAPMHPDYTPYDAKLRDRFAGTMIANNAVISTPCGTLVPVGPRDCLVNAFAQDTSLWKLQGVTRDNVGAAIGNCEVVAFETGQLFVGAAPVEGRTVSDGSGNYTIAVARVTHYEVVAYLAGAPDRAGITLRTLTPVPA